MISENIYTIIEIDEHSITPKYLQIINSIIKGIEDGRVHKDYFLPSINDLSYELEISRDTGIRAYRDLKNMGIINSVPGKGYFIANTDIKKRIKVFLLFNKLSAHKKILYDAFAAALGENAAIDFYIYNNDFSLFKELLNNKRDDYSYYVIIPHFSDGGENAYEIINNLPKEKLLLLDKLLPEVNGEYAAVYENFEKDIYAALEQALEPLKKYHTLKIIFPEYTYHPNEIVKGFQRFCNQYAFNCEVLNSIDTNDIKEGCVFISLMENDLVTLIETILNTSLTVGKEVGVISYNETPIKRIILNGITTISTDFQLMGERAAQLILDRSTAHVEIPFYLTLRASL
ncbi:GntR family transcriptional regulator [Foetidibacter luteolus]|uniref:GntR family transcriptional regulator n=1 Tax=Foetidibacter luteolus TaxID=2608880 RepID=UPI00129B6534|nr:substrate-binding domain-containing protein [Foetidibacter luteolus]